MSYPLINGAAINGTGGGDIVLLPPGLDLLAAGTHTAVGSTDAGDGEPLEFGDASLMYALEPDGLDLLDHGVHLGFYDPVLSPPGLDILQHGTPVMVVNPVAGDADVMDFGALSLQIGSPIQARPASLDLLTYGLHVADVGGVLPPPMTGIGVSARPLEFGTPSMAPGPYAAVAGGLEPLELGAPTLGVVTIAGAAEPLEFGDFASGMATIAGAAWPLELAVPGIGMAFAVSGMDLLTAGVHRAVGGAMAAVAGNAAPLELGNHGPIGFATITRQKFPLEIGAVSIHRGVSC